MSGGGGSLEASMVFEKLFTDYLKSHDSELRSLLVRKFNQMRAESSILGSIQVDADGTVSINIREGDADGTVVALAAAFDTLIDIAGFFTGEKEAFDGATAIISMVERQFSAPFAKLNIRDRILRGAMARRLPSGIDGLDEMMGGGLPASEMVILFGPPGTAKHHFALQFLADGLRRGGAGLVVLSSMSVTEMRGKLTGQGVHVPTVEAKGRLKTVDWYSQKSRVIVGLEERGHVIVPSKDIANLNIAFTKVMGALSFAPTTRAYIDMITPALNMYELSDVAELVRRLKASLRDAGAVSLFVVEEGAHDERVVSTLKHMADTVLALTGDDRGGLFFEILSMTSGKFKAGKVPVQVTSRGMSVKDMPLDEAGMISELSKIPLVSREMAQRLVDAGFTDVEKLNSATLQELIAVDMVTGEVARSILEYVGSVEFSQSLLASRSRKWLRKARDLIAAGELKKARKSLERALEIDPASTDAWSELAELDRKLTESG